MNKLQWNFNQNTKLLIQDNAFENIVCGMAAILSMGGGGGGGGGGDELNCTMRHIQVNRIIVHCTEIYDVLQPFASHYIVLLNGTEFYCKSHCTELHKIWYINWHCITMFDWILRYGRSNCAALGRMVTTLCFTDLYDDTSNHTALFFLSNWVFR